MAKSIQHVGLYFEEQSYEVMDGAEARTLAKIAVRDFGWPSAKALYDGDLSEWYVRCDGPAGWRVFYRVAHLYIAGRQAADEAKLVA